MLVTPVPDFFKPGPEVIKWLVLVLAETAHRAIKCSFYLECQIKKKNATTYSYASSLMKPNWLKLASLAQRTCTLDSFPSSLEKNTLGREPVKREVHILI